MKNIDHILSVLSRFLNYVWQWMEFIGLLIVPYWRQVLAGLIVFWLAMKMIDLLIAWTSVDKVRAKVNHKERVYYPKWFYSIYLVYTDSEVFCVKDTRAFLRFGASNRYSKIHIGHTYTFTVCGYRNRWESKYRNILKINKCKLNKHILPY